MNSCFKFPRRVRIHGGECGAVARALHHEAKIESLPAVKGNVFFTTNERKQMSTKTIFKRLALVVVSALGLSLLATVPTQAAYNSAASTTSITVTGVGRVNYGIQILAYSQNPGDSTNSCGNECFLHMRLTDAPSAAGTVATGSAAAGNIALVSESVTVTQFTEAGWALRTILHSAATSDTLPAGTYTFSYWVDTQAAKDRLPQSSHTGNLNGIKSGTVSVTLAGAPTQVTLTSASGTADSSSVTTNLVEATFKDAAGNPTLLNTSAGETYTIVSGSTVASANLPERISDTTTASGVLYTNVDSRSSTGVYIEPFSMNGAINGGIRLSALANNTAYTAVGTAGYSLTNNVAGEQFGRSTTTGRSTNGQGTVTRGRTVTPTTDSVLRFFVGTSKSGSSTFKVVGLNTLLGVESGNFTLTTTNPALIDSIVPNSSTARTALNAADTSSATLGVRNSSYGQPTAFTQADAAVSPTAVDLYASTVSGKTVSFYVTTNSSTGGLVVATVAARTGVILPTGITAGSKNYNTDTQTSYLSLAATAPNPGEGYDITFGMSNGKSVTYSVTYKAPTVSGTTGEGSVVTNLDGNTMKAAVGSSNTVTFTVKDGFGSAVSGSTVRFQHNRTANAAYSDLVNGTTDASGNVSFTFTDALTLAASGLTTLNRAGTVQYYVSTANATSNLTSTRTINYTTAAFITPGAITTSGNEVTDAVGAASGTYNLVDTVISETITVSTETGSVMAGIPYSAVLSAGLYERLNYASGLTQLSGFTNSSGQAFIRVACYKSGAQTVTWTVGTLTKTVNLTCQSTSSKLRSLAVDSTKADAAVDQTKEITVTATDIYGNVVPSASLTVTYTGANARIVSFNGAQGASATTDSAGKLVIGVYADKAGTGTLRITTTGGVLATTTTTTQGVAPIARVDDLSVTVTSTGVSAVQAAAEAATDAAAEAIDAANAATDAANLAAEAADAATVAAEEARDAADAATAAVEELATQVATLMAALKAQITTLANTVAKIAKKVKA